MKKVIFVIPMYNAAPHIESLVNSLKEQINPNWEAVFIDDLSDDDSIFMINHCSGNDTRFTVIKNEEKKWALKNVVEVSRNYQEDAEIIIAVLDADDCLCNERTVDLIIEAYRDDEVDTAWTGHKWDINNMNISKALPDKPTVNPYQYPWVSSHLKTFRASLLKDISDANFKNLENIWFKRGYDQALYLPLLYKSSKRKYIDEVCYLYRINSNSLKVRDWSEKAQMDTVRLVRARGFIS